MLVNEENLQKKKLDELRDIARDLGVKSVTTHRKADLIDKILDKAGPEPGSDFKDQQEQRQNHEKRKDRDEKIPVSGLLEVLPDGYGFLRSDRYEAGDDDTYVSPVQIRRFNLKTGDYIDGHTRQARETEKFSPLIYVGQVNKSSPEFSIKRKQFEDLTPIYPEEKFVLEKGSSSLAARLIDLVAPIGRGQRGLIVAPPKAGKTSLIKDIANAVVKAYPEVYVIVLLIDERPEEVTDISRSIVGDRVEIVASTFDELPSNHTRLAEFVLERSKRLVEHGSDVMVLMDSITRLTRAYNVTTPPSGRTLSGGLDPVSFNKPKRFFGAARNIEDGGSLTILGTALVETGSRMDDVIYEEFKGTGNMEVHLDRALSEVRVFPAIDIFKSGTRREEKLQTQAELDGMKKIRQGMARSSNEEIAESIFQTLESTSSNEKFLQLLEKTSF